MVHRHGDNKSDGWQQFGEDMLDVSRHLLLCSSQCSEEGECRPRVVRLFGF